LRPAQAKSHKPLAIGPKRQKRRADFLLTHRSNISPGIKAISAGMMSIDLSDLTPKPPRGTAASSSRGAPCAGLFGWRKDAAASPAPKREPKTPGRDYPAG
jgi:hypothetical protein